MNRIDFMIRLSAMLSDLPTAEREEAIQYYEDYLNDAGVENEEEVLAALGTPEELAASIREGLKEGNEQRGEFSENGFFEKGERLENEVARRDAMQDQESAAPDAQTGATADGRGRSAGFRGQKEAQRETYENAGGKSDSGAFSAGTGYDGGKGAGTGADGGTGFGTGNGYESGNARQTAGTGYGPSYGAHRPGGREGSLHERYRGRQKGNTSALFVLVAILAAPVVLPLLFAFGVVALVMIFVVVLVAAIFLFTGVICVIAGIATLIEAFSKLFLYPAGAVLIIGISLMVIGFGVLFTVAVGGLAGKLLPKMCRGLVNGIGGLFRRKGGRMA